MIGLVSSTYAQGDILQKIRKRELDVDMLKTYAIVSVVLSHVVAPSIRENIGSGN